MNRNTKIKFGVALVCFAVFVWAYLRHQARQIEVSNPPVVIVPKQPDVPAHDMSAEEKARLEKLKAEINAKLEKNNKSGKMPAPEADPTPK